MSGAKRLDLWQQIEYTAMKPGLSRIKAFLAAIGNPEKSFKSVHIAGTNGKGSTAMMIANIIESAGYKTGLYISPHLISINERISVNSRNISAERLEELGNKYYELSKKHGLTFFEFITAITFVYFAEKKVEVAVLETGLGGRFDATNVIEKPLLSIITAIDLDHTKILGKTIPLIAKEKAGIIKYKCNVISGAENKNAALVVRNAAKNNKSDLWEIDRDFKYKYIETDWKNKTQVIAYSGLGRVIKLYVPLLGQYQRKNSALAAAAAQMLKRSGLLIPETAIVKGITNSRWPGRFDVRSVIISGRRKTVILDGAHNPQAMDSFVSSFKESCWADKSKDVIFGALKDKDYVSVAKEVLDLGGRLIVTPVKSKRTLNRTELLKVFRTIDRNGRFVAADSLVDALKKTEADLVVITGSLYLVGEALKILVKGNH
jgi:dihydrofolate synthase/folylpolyglutamate synthase